MSARIHQARLVSDYSLLLHERGWVANHDGNVSQRFGANRFLISPTAVSKRHCSPESIVECSLDGKAVGPGKPPSEVALHVGAYAGREDVQAVLHAHPPHATAFSLARRALDPVHLPEAVVSIGPRIPLMPLALPKAPEAAGLAEAVLQTADVALLAGNGVLAVGPDLETAYLRLELLEHYCRILTIMEGPVGAPVPLSEAERDHLVGLRKKAGLHREGGAPAAASGPSDLARVVAEEVRRALADEGRR